MVVRAYVHLQYVYVYVCVCVSIPWLPDANFRSYEFWRPWCRNCSFCCVASNITKKGGVACRLVISQSEGIGQSATSGNACMVNNDLEGLEILDSD